MGALWHSIKKIKGLTNLLIGVISTQLIEPEPNIYANLGL